MSTNRKQTLRPVSSGQIAGYARLSTVEQAQGSTLEQQISRLRGAGAQKIYCDLESGARDNRTELVNLLEDCRAGLIRQIIMTRIDRLSRRTRTVLEIAEELEGLGVALVVLDQHVDTSTASGKMFLSVLASVSQFELDTLKERIGHGIAYRKKHGNAHQTPPYGYVRVEREGVDRLEPDLTPLLCDLSGRAEWSAWSLARWTVEMYLTTGSLRRTMTLGAERFGFVPVSKHNLRRWMSKPALRGHLVWADGTIFENAHQPLIDERTAREVDRLLAQQAGKRGYGSREECLARPFTGRVICVVCGQSCTYQQMVKPSGRVFKYYRCHRYGQGGAASCPNRHRVRTEVLDAAVGQALRERARVLVELAAGAGQEPAAMPEEVLRLEAELAQLEAMPVRSGIVEGAIRELRTQIALLTHDVHKQHEAAWLDRQELIGVFKDPGFWQSLTDPDKKRLIQTFVRRVVIGDGQVVQVELAV